MIIRLGYSANGDCVLMLTGLCTAASSSETASMCVIDQTERPFLFFRTALVCPYLLLCVPAKIYL